MIIKKIILLCILTVTVTALLTSCFSLFATEPKVYSPELLPEERSSIVLGKLSKEHEYYQEVTTID
ncbi:MAG: hypothetical protein PHP22_10490, partial [Oscillospiraceae bacterium]|nr:hypothetical protein [Oscillospiraceae bacterium]